MSSVAESHGVGRAAARVMSPRTATVMYLEKIMAIVCVCVYVSVSLFLVFIYVYYSNDCLERE